MRVTNTLLADDTTFLDGKDDGEREVKRVMEEWQERNYEEKEVVLEFGT